jgi:hypothetical protein
MLSARAMEQLDRVGVAAALAAHAQPLDRLAGVAVRYDHPDTRFAGVHVVARRTVEEKLLACVGVTAPVARLRALEPAGSRVRAHVTTGTLRTRYAVVCEAPCTAGTPTTADLREQLWTGRRLARRARYRAGRVLYAGELGASAGVQDAANLAWRLAAVVHGAPARLLVDYAIERRPREVHRWLPHALPAVVRAASRSHVAMGVLAGFASELDVAYPRSRLVRESAVTADEVFRRALRPGERVPDITIASATLHALLDGTDPHVLALGDCEAAPLRALELRTGLHVRRLRYSQATAHVFRVLGVTTAATYVIRPDLHVGFRSHGPRIDELAHYLDDVLPPRRPDRDVVRRSRSVAP